MREDIESLLNKDKDYTIEVRNELDGKIVATDFFKNTISDVDEFDKLAWENKSGYDSPNFPSFTKFLEGWSAGFYVWAGLPNMGKTAIMTNIMNDLCMKKENKLFGIYFTLDDPRNKIIPRIVAMNELIPINLIAKPGRYKEMIIEGHPNSILIDEQLKKREQGLKNLKDNSDKMIIFDSKEIENIDDIYEKARQIQSYVKAIDPEMNIIICIDSLKDIQLDLTYGKLTVNEKIDVVSKKLKDLSNELNCIVFASMHLRKLNANRRPNMEDLKDSNTLEYEIDACFLVHNDVSKNKQAAKVFYRESEESADKMPVLEIDWGKNKLSSYKGITFCNFAPEYSKCVECDEDSAIRYNALIYEI